MLVIFTSAVSASVLSTLRFCFCVLHGVCSGTNSRSLTSVRHATVCNRMRAPRATAKIALQQTASSLVRLSAAGVKLYHDRSIYLPLVTVFIILSHLSWIVSTSLSTSPVQVTCSLPAQVACSSLAKVSPHIPLRTQNTNPTHPRTVSFVCAYLHPRELSDSCWRRASQISITVPLDQSPRSYIYMLASIFFSFYSQLYICILRPHFAHTLNLTNCSYMSPRIWTRWWAMHSTPTRCSANRVLTSGSVRCFSTPCFSICLSISVSLSLSLSFSFSLSLFPQRMDPPFSLSIYLWVLI